jgi:hypothetical protein
LTRYRSILAATCGLAVLAVAGCTENPPASTLPPPSTTPPTTPGATPSQTPKPQPPVMPVAAKVKSKAGLEAFARYWIALESYVHATGDPAPYLALSLPGCEWCTGIAEIYRSVYAAGGRYEGDLAVEVREFHLFSLPAGDEVGITAFRGYFPRTTKIAKAGAQPIGQKSALVDYSINAIYRQGGWKVESATMTVIREGV